MQGDLIHAHAAVLVFQRWQDLSAYGALQLQVSPLRQALRVEHVVTRSDLEKQAKKGRKEGIEWKNTLLFASMYSIDR